MNIRAKQKVYLLYSIDMLQPREKTEPIFNSFKRRASQIKDKFNYRFDFKHRDGFNDFPDYDRIEFVKP